MYARFVKRFKRYFSIVIPTLNEEKYLPLLLSDLQNQSFRDFEVIVVDALSKDETLAKARGFETKIPSLCIIKSDRPNVSIQRNVGAREARGKWLIFMDADDRVDKFYLKEMEKKLKKSHADIFTNWSDVDSPDKTSELLIDVINIGIEIGKFVRYPVANGALIGIKKAIFDKVGGFNPDMSYLEDTEFVNRAYKKGYKFHIFHNPKYTYSLRRYRKYGIWKSVKKEIELQLKTITKMEINDKKERPMGGDIYLN